MSRTVALDLLKSLHVASPCAASWDDMVGDDRVRHCAGCRLNVYNLSAMSADEAAALVLEEKEGKLCIQMYKRADGTVITQDCPVGVRALRMKAARAIGKIAAAALFLVGGGMAVASNSRDQRVPRLKAMRPFSDIRALLWPAVPPPVPPMMGKISITGNPAIPQSVILSGAAESPSAAPR